MASIKLNDFKGLTPRTGEQLLDPGHAVGATNVDLDSGALRPLITPHLENIFPRAGEPGFLAPKPVDPSAPRPLDPTDPGLPGVPVPPECIPVVITSGPGDQLFPSVPETITFTVTTNVDATGPVVVRWYIDDVLIAGESGLTLTISPHDLQIEYNNGELVLSPNIPVITSLYGVIKVVVQNPCGVAEAFATVTLENEYSCEAFARWAADNATYYWPADNSHTDGFLAGFGTTPDIPIVEATANSFVLRGGTLFPDCEGGNHWEVIDKSGPEVLYFSSGGTTIPSGANNGLFVPLNLDVACVWRQSAGGFSAAPFDFQREWYLPNRDGTVVFQLRVITYNDGDIELAITGASERVSVGLADGRPHLIGFSLSGLPAAVAQNGSFVPAVRVYFDGEVVINITGFVQAGNSNAYPFPPPPFVFSRADSEELFCGGSTDGSFSHLVLGSLSWEDMAAAFRNNFQGDPP